MEFLTGIGDDQITGDTDRLKHATRLVNSRYQQVVTMVLDSQDDWDWDDQAHADFPLLTSSLVADQQTYSLPASEKILNIQRVEVNYTAALPDSGWYKAEPFDVMERGSATDATSIKNDFSTAAPFYDIRWNALWLYPIPAAAVTNGLKIWVTREPDEFTTADTTQEPGIDEPFHRMIAVGAALDWSVAKGLDSKIGNLSAIWNDYEARLRRHYGSKDRDRHISFGAAYTDYESGSV